MKCPHCNKHVGEYTGRIHFRIPKTYACDTWSFDLIKPLCQCPGGTINYSENVEDIDCKGCLRRYENHQKDLATGAIKVRYTAGAKYFYFEDGRIEKTSMWR